MVDLPQLPRAATSEMTALPSFPGHHGPAPSDSAADPPVAASSNPQTLASSTNLRPVVNAYHCPGLPKSSGPPPKKAMSPSDRAARGAEKWRRHKAAPAAIAMPEAS